MSLRDDLGHAIAAARDRAIASGAFTIPVDTTLPAIGIERPANPDHGDWASNVAMQLAPVARLAPMRVAQAIVDHLQRPAAIASAEVAPPGFLNLRL
ncbi:MAG: arginine--tRNA ligase, partial [Candidatus Limnocylindria bacterium]